MNRAVILFILAVFFFNNLTLIDPDFGWHLKLGELISMGGIPKTDPFSYTMPSFPFVDHEWLTNIIFYRLYQMIGTIGMSFLFAAISLIALLIVKSQNKSKFFLAPFFLACAVLLPFLGVRPQVETWVLTAILLKVVTSDNFWRKWKWLFPVYFLLWANLHGGFALGLVIFTLVLISRSLVKKKILLSDIILWLSCVGITLLNPYGFNLWKEILQQLSDNHLRSAIVEWIPLLLSFNLMIFAFLPLAILSGILIYHYRSRLTYAQISLYSFLLLASLASQRHTPIWVLSALPLTSQGLGFFYQEIHSIKFARQRFDKAYKIFLIITFVFLILEIVFYAINLSQRQEENMYPQRAVQFLKRSSLQGRIFSSYNWGGYLIWNLPQQKVFVDGRMPSWRWCAPSKQESSAAFDEYEQVADSNDGLKILDKYQVQYVLWPSEPHAKDNLFQKIQYWKQKIVAKFLHTSDHIPSLGKKLEDAHWQKIYQDSTATFFKRPKDIGFVPDKFAFSRDSSLCSE